MIYSLLYCNKNRWYHAINNQNIVLEYLKEKSSTSRISSTHTNSIYYKDLDQRETSSLVH